VIRIVNGDLLEAKEKVICHQVNCQNAMGSGVAKAIYSVYPEVKEEYHKRCDQIPKRNLLGSIQVVPIKSSTNHKMVINIFGQYDYGRKKKQYTNYHALKHAFTLINDMVESGTLLESELAFPHCFGCGLAGGDWAVVEDLMLKYMPSVDITIYKKD